MNAFDPSIRAPCPHPGPKTSLPWGVQPVGQAVHQRHLGSDDEEVGVKFLGGGRGAGQASALPANDR